MAKQATQAPPAQDAPPSSKKDAEPDGSLGGSNGTLEPMGNKRWTWRDGEWVHEDINTLDDAAFVTLLKLMPASAWNMIAGTFDQAGFRPSDAEDAQLVKDFLLGLTRHPRFAPLLRDALQKRRGGGQ